MEAKEKAQELINKFSDYSETWDYTNDQPLECNYAEQCALIAVDEILMSSEHFLILNRNPLFTGEYWKQVKQEIEKLK